MKLSKTDFLIFRECAHNAWVKLHRPEVYRAEPLSAFDQALLEAGNEVDALARQLFPGGCLIARGDAETTARLVAERLPVLYQPVFETDQFTTACDILVWNAASARYDLFEVKASSSESENRARDEAYTYDLAFQSRVLDANGVPLGRHILVRLDSAYVRDADLDIHALFHLDDRSDAVSALGDVIAHEMDTAHDLLSRATPLPAPCNCMTKGRSAHCTTFAFTNTEVPAYSVHDITRIGASKKKLAELVDRGILDIREVPDDFELSDTQRNQVRAARSGRIWIDEDAIADHLGTLAYPLAFLDYETFPAAIPRFPGYGPFHHIPFQYSLDVIRAPGAAVEHFEFLHIAPTCPDMALLDALRRDMPATGSVITWNQTFERGINDKLAARNPSAASFLIGVNARVVDLMDVFSDQAYVHPGFRGRTSIKAILPVLVPALSYKALAIQEGATATVRWNEIATGAVSEAEASRIAADLLAYCALDTRAMVEIWRVLEGEVGADSWNRNHLITKA
jgi:hypothetical protein